MYTALRCGCMADETSFLEAKDGPRDVVTWPGWLGCIDLFMFLGALPLFILGMYQEGPQTFCFSGLLMLPVSK
jgi:hypothetical protein